MNSDFHANHCRMEYGEYRCTCGWSAPDPAPVPSAPKTIKDSDWYCAKHATILSKGQRCPQCQSSAENKS